MVETRSPLQCAFNIDYFDHCVHCGLCLPTCPTYVQTGDENESPRGRIHLMQALAGQKLSPSATVHRHLESCLNCRACETTCPSGVEYGALIEAYRTHIDERAIPRSGLLRRATDWTLRHVFPFARRTKWLLRAVRLAQAAGFFDFLARSGLFDQHKANMMFGQVLQDVPRIEGPLPRHARASGPHRDSVALFSGCVQESILGATNRATLRVLQHNGCDVRCPQQQVCCGALHYHGGDAETARHLARTNIAAFEQTRGAVIVNAAGCGLMLKDYAILLGDDPDWSSRAACFTSRVRDVHEFLAALPLHPAPAHGLKRQTVAYHDACHLCHGQRIRTAPRAVLAAIGNIDLVTLPESEMCCGAAGSYSLTAPDMAGQLAARKLEHAAGTAATCIAAGNVGCILHLKQQARLRELSIEIVHPVDLLDLAYGPSRSG